MEHSILWYFFPTYGTSMKIWSKSGNRNKNNKWNSKFLSKENLEHLLFHGIFVPFTVEKLIIFDMLHLAINMIYTDICKRLKMDSCGFGIYNILVSNESVKMHEVENNC